MKAESKFDVNESENPSDFTFAKSCRNPTTIGFELRHCYISKQQQQQQQPV